VATARSTAARVSDLAIIRELGAPCWAGRSPHIVPHSGSNLIKPCIRLFLMGPAYNRA